jgi:hypothetical protein
MALTDLGLGNAGLFGKNSVLSVSYEFLGNLFRPHDKASRLQRLTGRSPRTSPAGQKRALHGPDPRDMDYLRDIDGL